MGHRGSAAERILDDPSVWVESAEPTDLILAEATVAFAKGDRDRANNIATHDTLLKRHATDPSVLDQGLRRPGRCFCGAAWFPGADLDR